MLAPHAARGLKGRNAIEDRLVTAEEAPGSKADPDEARQTTADFDGFIATLGEGAVDPTTKELTEVFQEAGVDTVFCGATHTPGGFTHAVAQDHGVLAVPALVGTRFGSRAKSVSVPVPVRRVDQTGDLESGSRADIELVVADAQTLVTSVLLGIARRRPSRQAVAQLLEHAQMMAHSRGWHQRQAWA